MRHEERSGVAKQVSRAAHLVDQHEARNGRIATKGRAARHRGVHVAGPTIADVDITTGKHGLVGRRGFVCCGKREVVAATAARHIEVRVGTAAGHRCQETAGIEPALAIRNGGEVVVGERRRATGTAPRVVTLPNDVAAVRRRADDHAAVLASQTINNRCFFAVAALDRRRGLAVAHDQAFEVLAQDDVDHTTDGVRAINGRCAVGQDLDALNGRHRDRVHVNGVADCRRFGNSAAINQDQCAGATNATQVNTGKAHRRTAALRAELAGRREGATANEFGNGHAAAGFQLLARHHRDRQ